MFERRATGESACRGGGSDWRVGSMGTRWVSSKLEVRFGGFGPQSSQRKFWWRFINPVSARSHGEQMAM